MLVDCQGGFFPLNSCGQPMHIGVCSLQFRLPESASLKDKRGVFRSISTRVRNRFNVSIAEVDDNDRRQLLTLGVCCVSNDPQHANEMLSRVVSYIQGIRPDAELLDYTLEIISGD